MRRVWVLIDSDRHLDPMVEVFGHPDSAVAALSRVARDAGWPMDNPPTEGTIASCSHPTESDYAHVIEREVQA